jgi:hypothetical protein
MGTVSDARKLGSAWKREYREVVRRAVRRLPPRPQALIELGCGRGQLTVPLARAVPGADLLLADRFAPPYSADGDSLRREVPRWSVRRRVRVVVDDVRRPAALVGERNADAIISNELLPELTAPEIARLLRR